MAQKIPMVNAPTVSPQVERAGHYAPRAVPSQTVGGAVAEGLREDVLPVADKLIDAADRERVQADLKKLADWKYENVDHPQKGALAKKLSAAAGVTDQTDAAYKTEIDRIKESLTNGNQRRIFEKETDDDRIRLRRALANHENQQLDASGDLAFKLRMDDHAETMARAAALGDWTTVMETRQAIANDSYERAPLKGWSEKDGTLHGVIKEAVGNAHERVLKVMIDGRKDYEGARQYLSTYGGEMNSKASTDYAKHLEAVSKPVEDAKVEVAAWDIIESDSTDRATGRFNPDLAKARFDMMPAEFRAKVEEKINKRIADAVSLQNAEDNQKVARLVSNLRETGKIDFASRDWSTLDSIGQEQVRAKLEAHENMKTAKRWQQTAQDREDLNDFRANLIHPDTQEATLGLDEGALNARYANSSPANVKRMVLEQAKVAAAREKGGNIGRDEFFAHVNRIVEGLAKKDAVKAKKFKVQMDEWLINNIDPKTNMLPDRNKAIEYADSQVLSLDIPFFAMGTGWGKDRYMFEATPEEKARWKPYPSDKQPLEAGKEVMQKREAQAQETASLRQTATGLRANIPEKAKINGWKLFVNPRTKTFTWRPKAAPGEVEAP